MEFILNNRSIVIIANNFNPSIINRHWLIENKILEDSDFREQSLFAENISQIITDDFNILVLIQQLQFTINNGEKTKSSLEKLAKIITLLSHTPFSAIGVNILYLLDASNDSVLQKSNKLFSKPDINLYKSFFNTPDSKFGGYMSRDFIGSRLKLNINPVRVMTHPNIDSNKDYIQFSFNFHIQLNATNPTELLLNSINNWEKYFEFAKAVTESF